MIGLPNDDNWRNNSVKRVVLQRKREIFSILVVIALAALFFCSDALGYLKIALQSNDKSVCPIHESRAPPSFFEDNSTAVMILNDEKFRLQSVQKLAGAVQIDTQVQDDQPDVPDAPEVWERFQKFHKYLEKTFPSVYENLEVQKVNTYGLVFHWKGSNSKLKPLMLTAHQDVVPVQKNTLKDWIYPPFDGHYDGKYIHGRGASDCKNTLIAILESIELLISNKFKPERGLIAAFGFDEESTGIRGANMIAKYLEKTYGHDSVYALIDEGTGLIKDSISGQFIAIPGSAEKGDLNVHIQLNGTGGHSSLPPPHTAIGIMSELTHMIEEDPYDSKLGAKNPLLGYLKCIATNTDSLPKMTRKAILRAGFDKLANSKAVKFLQSNFLTSFLIKTTQAVDVFQGGEKANSLPEDVRVIVNHRVAIDSSFAEVEERFTHRVVEVAKKHGLSVNAFGKDVLEGDSKKGHFIVDVSNPIPAAPLSPTNDTVWEYLAGVTRHVFEDLVFTNLTYPIMMVPYIFPATTDTKYYANLTSHIYRYTPSTADMSENHVHSVDEKISVDNHLQVLTFYYEYIQTVGTSKAGN